MFDDCECELCGVPAVRTLRGILLCEFCDPEEDEDEDAGDPPNWPNEIPMGLLDWESPCPETLTQ